MFRTHKCNELKKTDVGQTVTLAGWVNTRRDHGGLIFIDLRDRYGITQVKFDPTISEAALKTADQVRSEWVIKVTGEVIARPDNMTNKNLATGEIELAVKEIEILSKAKTPPFEIDSDKAINEDLRLKYRFVDLRRRHMLNNLIFRAEVIKFIRDWMHGKDFLEIETPILTASSPEGARDFLVPSRIHAGKFYALPQAPQQYKQLLMVGGIDKYFQIAPCFRDEDPRADRSPGEFYQLDVETSFLTQDEFFALMEPLLIEVSEKFSTKKVWQKPFPRLKYEDIIMKYGMDKPDLRFGMEIQDLTELVRGCGFSVFAKAVEDGGVVRALVATGAAKFSRGQIDELTEFVKGYGAKGLAYIVVEESGELKSPINKFLGDDLAKKIVEIVGAKAGDIVFFGADRRKIVETGLGQLRSKLGDILNLKDPNLLAWAWVVDFPMFEYNEELKKIDFAHNPFSMPQGGMEALKTQDPLTINAFQYDIICNGLELSSGAVRNFNPEIMYKAFELAGYGKEVVDKKFGAMIAAFEYGAPPHCGFAPGIERLIMLLRDEPSIREVMAFPKNGKAEDVMMNAPSEVDDKQLKELHIKLDMPKKKE